MLRISSGSGIRRSGLQIRFLDWMSQLTSWDFTIFEGHNDFKLDHVAVVAHLQEWCRKWVFQLEKCPTSGTLHLQGRVQLIKKKRLSEWVKQCPFKAHWTPTCNTVHIGCCFNYVLKADTRVDGPWQDSTWTEPPKVTRQLKTFMDHDLRPWQSQLYDMVQREDDRKITMIYDAVGNSGKSIFSEYLEYKQLAFELPPMRIMEDIMQFCFSFEDQKCYLVDMPRAMKKDKLGEFYAGLECLKNGVVYDKRYSGKKRRMDRPQIVVFTNVLPEWSFMSADRWDVWVMTADYRLIKYAFKEQL